MRPERILHLMDKYQEQLAPLCDGDASATHVYNMCTRMRDVVASKDAEKVWTWLGFIQCFLWDRGVYTLQELKGHNGWENDANEPAPVYADPGGE